ncbi:MAG: hypothetical protein ACR2NF_03700 [Pirellulales bacterium]
MKNRETHFDVNNSKGVAGEAVVRDYLSLNCKVLQKKAEWDADATLDLGCYGLVGVGVEVINGWKKAGEYQYPFYNLLTHKRARKMLNREEVILFVLSSDLSQFMVVLPSYVPREAHVWEPNGLIQKAGGGGFRRGSSEDPLMMMACPWGYINETAFRVPRKRAMAFDEAPEFPYHEAMRKTCWNGPEPKR